MEEMIPCQVKDQEVFQRVWQRVMAGRSEESSPIQPGSPVGSGDLPCRCLEALMHPEGGGVPPECLRRPEEPAPAPQAPPAEEAGAMPQPSGWEPAQDQPVPEPPNPAPPCPTAGESLPDARGLHRGSDLPQPWEDAQGADDRTVCLRRHVMDALEGWQFYRHLAKRARGADQRVLNSLAGELHKHARKLSAAYFLLTGLRYWPSELLGAPAIPSYWGALRARHQAEQRQEGAFRMACDDWEDPELLAMYGELADCCQRRCRQLRTLLEQGIT